MKKLLTLLMIVVTSFTATAQTTTMVSNGYQSSEFIEEFDKWVNVKEYSYACFFKFNEGVTQMMQISPSVTSIFLLQGIDTNSDKEADYYRMTSSEGFTYTLIVDAEKRTLVFLYEHDNIIKRLIYYINSAWED